MGSTFETNGKTATRLRALVALLAAGALVGLVTVVAIAAPARMHAAAVAEYTKPTKNPVPNPAPTPTPTPAPPPSKTPATPARSVLTILTLPPTVHLGTRRPTITVRARLAEPTHLLLSLLDAKGHVLATWSTNAKAGAVKLELPLPAKARHPGHDVLRISPVGSSTARVKKLPVVLRI